MRDIKVYLLVVLRDANAGNRFDLTPVRGEAEALKAALVAFYDGIAAGDIKPAAANHVIQRLARIFVPLNFMREQRFRHDPAIPALPLPCPGPAPTAGGAASRE
ncbi:hypothetical protein [Martelella mediterranea]|uniref:Uncharacterized protein n=1 Tax=Martelella mediterranea DSM 17316 TaxID=1122214 RepID=A0A1U9Z8M7_9HYPH|nr:hypothetical protein [Martelella mediterranea]AQZ54069.1 hypothetical protein Mame_04777 [Martelella mediterranea DSM 17316]